MSSKGRKRHDTSRVRVGLIRGGVSILGLFRPQGAAERRPAVDSASPEPQRTHFSRISP